MNPISGEINQKLRGLARRASPFFPLPFWACWAMLVWSEVVFRIFVLGKLWGVGLWYILLFSAAAAFLCQGISTLLPPKAAWCWGLLWQLGGLVLYGSQLVYNKIFHTYYTIFSAANGGAAFQFWTIILQAVRDNLLPLVLLMVPTGLYLWRMRPRFCRRRGLRGAGLALAGLAVFHLGAVGATFLTGRGSFTPYDLYFDTAAINYSVDRLGLLTTMRLDGQRLATGFQSQLILEEEEPAQPAMAQPQEDEEEAVLPNILPIDFETLMETETDELVLQLHQAFSTAVPTLQNEKTGLFEGDNLIMIVGETFSGLAVDPQLTPTLYMMSQEGFRFTNFYVPIWGNSTIDGEYVTCQGLLPKQGVWAMYKSAENDLPFTLGNQFKALGYTTNAYHDHSYDYYMRHLSHPNMGYTYKGLGNGLEVTPTWPESDLEMMEVTIPEYIDQVPFHTYYMTVSGHMEYNFYGNAMAIKNQEYVQDLPYSDAAKAYLACNIELDRAMEKLLEALDQAGLAETTVISLSPDHYPYGLPISALNELWGHEVEQNFEMYKTCWILYKKGMTPETVDRPCSNLDILPTLSNLFGLDYDSRLLMGTDVFSTAAPLVIFENRSWITDKAMYNAATGQVTPTTDEEVTQDYIDRINRQVSNKFVLSAQILDTNYYAKVVPGALERRAANEESIQENDIPGAGQGPYGKYGVDGEVLGGGPAPAQTAASGQGSGSQGEAAEEDAREESQEESQEESREEPPEESPEDSPDASQEEEPAA